MRWQVGMGAIRETEEQQGRGESMQGIKYGKPRDRQCGCGGPKMQVQRPRMTGEWRCSPTECAATASVTTHANMGLYLVIGEKALPTHQSQWAHKGRNYVRLDRKEGQAGEGVAAEPHILHTDTRRKQQGQADGCMNKLELCTDGEWGRDREFCFSSSIFLLCFVSLLCFGGIALSHPPPTPTQNTRI